jgi:CMP-N-acetylneuraminic acid synthetase
MATLAVIPARGGSKGLPGKNIRDLAGKPLIAYTIEAALNADFIDRVVVSTDDTKIAEVAVKYCAEVPFLRPAELASDTAGSVDVVIHTLDFYRSKGTIFENIILLQPTSPLRDTNDIKGAFELYRGNKCDSVISVCEAMVHPLLLRTIGHEGCMKEFVEQKDKHLRRQDMEKVYQLNGAIYITAADKLIASHSFYGDANLPYIMSQENSIDIDCALDLQLAELILKNRYM